jgi:hypothetical protein
MRKITLLLILFFGSVAFGVAEANLVAWYKMDENAKDMNEPNYSLNIRVPDACATIQGAIWEANSLIPSANNRIQIVVADGCYPEAIRMVSYVDVNGEDGDRGAIIYPTAPISVPYNEAAVGMASHSRLSNVTVYANWTSRVAADANQAIGVGVNSLTPDYNIADNNIFDDIVLKNCYIFGQWDSILMATSGVRTDAWPYPTITNFRIIECDVNGTYDNYRSAGTGMAYRCNFRSDDINTVQTLIHPAHCIAAHSGSAAFNATHQMLDVIDSNITTTSNENGGTGAIAVYVKGAGAVSDINFFNCTMTCHYIGQDANVGQKVSGFSVLATETFNIYGGSLILTNDANSLQRTTLVRSGGAGGKHITIYNGFNYDANLTTGDINQGGTVTYTLFDVCDSAGGTQGTLVGAGKLADHSTTGPINRALYFNGTDHVDTGDDFNEVLGNPSTVTWWMKPNRGYAVGDGNSNMVFNQTDSTSGDYQFEVALLAGKLVVNYFNGMDEEFHLAMQLAPQVWSVDTNDWKFIAVSLLQFDENNTQMKVYANGSLIATSDPCWEVTFLRYAEHQNTTLWIGEYHGSESHPYNGIIDDVRIYNKALDANEILALYYATNIPPTKASAPIPADTNTGVAIDANLVWDSNADANSHLIYFGTTNPPPFILEQSGTLFDCNILDYNTVYYWQIDEKNTEGITIEGDIWSFTTELAVEANFITIPNPNDVRIGVKYGDGNSLTGTYKGFKRRIRIW